MKGSSCARGAAAESDKGRLQTTCLCGFCFRLCVEKVAHGTVDAILISYRFGAFWERLFDVRHLREGEIGGSDVTFRFVTRVEDWHIELLEVGFEVLDVVCKQACAKGGKSGPKTLRQWAR